MSVDRFALQSASTRAQTGGHVEGTCTAYGEQYVAMGLRKDISIASAFAFKANAGTPSFRVQGGAEQTSNGYLQIWIPGPKRVVAISGICQIAGAPILFFKNATGLGAADADFAFSPSTGTIPIMMLAHNNATTNWWSVFNYAPDRGSIPCPDGILIWGSPYIPPTTVDPNTMNRAIKTSDTAVIAYIGVNVHYVDI